MLFIFYFFNQRKAWEGGRTKVMMKMTLRLKKGIPNHRSGNWLPGSFGTLGMVFAVKQWQVKKPLLLLNTVHDKS